MNTKGGKINPWAIILTFAKILELNILPFLFFANEKKQGSLCEQPVFAFELPEKKIITSNNDINFSFESKSFIRKLESALQYFDNIRCQYHQPGKIKYCTGKDLYRWSRGKSRPFLLTTIFFCFYKQARFSRDQR
jgi:hypothetical protein